MNRFIFSYASYFISKFLFPTIFVILLVKMGKNYVEKQMKKLLVEEQEKLEREVQEAVRNRLKKVTD